MAAETIMRPGLQGLPETGAPTLSVYPNPATEVVNIVAGTPGHYKLRITTVTGSTVYHTEYRQTLTVPVHNWAEGVYLMEIVDQQGKKHLYKLVKSGR